MRILLTGCTGLLGKESYALMHKEGWEIIPLIRQPLNLPQEIIFDATSPAMYQQLLSLPPCQAILHLASHIDFSSTAKAEAFFPATLYLTSLLTMLARHWDAHLVFSSSISIFEQQPYLTAASPINPVSVYAKTKYLAENIISAAGLNCFTLLRYAGIYGFTPRFNLSINKFIFSALQNNIPPVIYGKGEDKRNYLYAKDAAFALIYSLKHKIAGTYLLGGPTTLSIKEMAEKICQVFLPSTSPNFQAAQQKTVDVIVETSNLFSPIFAFDFESALKDLQASYGDMQ